MKREFLAVLIGLPAGLVGWYMEGAETGMLIGLSATSAIAYYWIKDLQQKVGHLRSQPIGCGGRRH